MKILFLCTHNRCRSILNEAIFNHMAPPGFVAYSAGSDPSGTVHPLTLAALARAGVSTIGLRSKSSDEFFNLVPDAVITVCNKAAGEACPLYFGEALRAHWNLEDPSSGIAEADASRSVAAAFDDTIKIIRGRLAEFFALPFDSLSSVELQAVLHEIGGH
jgi:Protein-tyrosine-phosphatase